MRDYTIENPIFSDKISIVEEDDLVSAENDTAASKQLLQNDLVLQARMDKYLGSDDNTEGPEFAEGIQSEDVIGAINEVFQLGSAAVPVLSARVPVIFVLAALCAVYPFKRVSAVTVSFDGSIKSSTLPSNISHVSPVEAVIPRAVRFSTSCFFFSLPS